MTLFSNLMKCTSQQIRSWKFSETNKIVARHFAGAYDPDGKTVISILNTEENAPLMIDAYSYFGFRFNNGMYAVGPIALFPRTVLSWNVEDDRDINERSLSLFFHLHPKLDVFLIGLSDATDQKHIIETRNKVMDIINTKGYRKINVEVMPTESAVTTFNFLNSDQRFVGAALVPPIKYSPNLNDQYRTEYLTKKSDAGNMFIE